jgi:hypothetical protein
MLLRAISTELQAIWVNGSDLRELPKFEPTLAGEYLSLAALRRGTKYSPRRDFHQRTLSRSIVQSREALEQPVHIVRRGLAVREQDAVADRGDQDVDRFFDRKCSFTPRQSAALEGLEMVGRVSATARGGDF